MRRAVVAWVAAVSCCASGCSAALGAGVTDSSAARHYPDFDARIAGQLFLPRDFRTFVSGEMNGLASLSRTVASEQWRLAAGVGRAWPSRVATARYGLELAGHAGIARGNLTDSSSRTAALLNLRASFPLRLVGSDVPWKSDSIADPELYLVPQLGADALLFTDHDPTGELSFVLALRGKVPVRIMP